MTVLPPAHWIQEITWSDLLCTTVQLRENSNNACEKRDWTRRVELVWFRTAEISRVSILFSRYKPEEPALFPLLNSSLYHELHFCVLLVIHNPPWNRERNACKNPSPIRVSKWKSIAKWEDILKPKILGEQGEVFLLSLSWQHLVPVLPVITPVAADGAARLAAIARSTGIPRELPQLQWEKAIAKVEQKVWGKEGGWINMSGLSWHRAIRGWAETAAHEMVFGVGKGG